MTKGYTLIEILVGITIIGILFSVGYASFREFSRRQALNGAVKGIQGDIRLAQEEAISGKKPKDSEDPQQRCAGANYLDGYNFKINSDGYSVEAVCSGLPVSIKTVALSGIDISATSPSILFKSLGHGTDIPEGSNVVITVTQVSTESSITITVSPSGEIR